MHPLDRILIPVVCLSRVDRQFPVFSALLASFSLADYGVASVEIVVNSGRNKEIISLVRRTNFVTSNQLVRHSHHLSNK